MLVIHQNLNIPMSESPKPLKLKFGFDYWLNQLIEIGKKIDGESKYTADYIRTMRIKWRDIGLSRLHQKVVERKQQTGPILNP